MTTIIAMVIICLVTIFNKCKHFLNYNTILQLHTVVLGFIQNRLNKTFALADGLLES